jgi:branched-chain amino acid aminotransferase
MSFIWHNGEFIAQDTPVYTAHTRLRRGECVFNTMPAVDGKIVRAQAHMEKLLHDAQIYWGDDFNLNFYLPPTLTLPPMGGGKKRGALRVGGLIDAANNLLKKNNFINGRYSMNVILTPDDAGDMSITIRAQSAPGSYPPIHAIIAQSVRRNEGSPLSSIKCGQYADNIFALREAHEKGGNEAIMLNNLGHVTCGTTSNIFIVKGNKLYTPPLTDGVQAGLTRARLIETFGAIEQSLIPDDLFASEGIYLTSSVRGVVPVITLDKVQIAMPSLKIPNDFHLS